MRTVLLVVAVVIAGSCGRGATAEPQTLADLVTGSGVRVVDLTHTLDARIPVFPGGTRLAVETLVTIERDGYYANRFTTGEHTGTHVDAPSHFARGGAAVDRIEPATLVGSGAVIDVAARAARAAEYDLGAADVEAWERRHGRLTAGHIVLVRTGWSARWPDEARYQNKDGAGVMRFPGVSVAASRLLRSRGVRAIGIDTLSTDHGSSSEFAQHKHFLGAGGYHIENLTNLDRLPADGAVIVVAPLPIRNGSGAPARVLALVPR